MIDTHAHIYLPEFENDKNEIIGQAHALGIDTILLPAIDSSTHNAMISLESEYKSCLAMIGLHPCSVKENYQEELDIVKHFLVKRKFIAIGEIGLDFYWDKTFIRQQYEAFEDQIKISIEHDLPIAIHSRNATDECIEVIERYQQSRGVFHCFSGNAKQAKKIIDAGYMLGIGGVVTFKNAGVDKVIAETGIGHVVLETDAPYLAPVPYRGKRNEPAYLTYIVEKLSAITALSAEEVIELTTRNAEKLFRLRR